MDKIVQNYVTSKGCLHNLGWYLDWNPEDEMAVLDGSFTAEQLQDISNHMKTHRKPIPFRKML